ncbi:MAG: hypothetical protein NZ805_03350 [Armatimonadetes bacterium]|nr:hypothetical protein [Armatimonadota bacterium]MDW8027337.1 hypothetical protein [Armatimonadota bacterium]
MDWETNDWLFTLLLVLNFLCIAVWAWLWLKAKFQPEKAKLFASLLTATSLSTFASIATLPSSPPFQPDHALGIGLLACSLGSSLSFWLSETKGKLWSGYIFNLLPFAIPLTLHSSDPFPSLWGLLIGSVLFWFCLGEISRSRSLTVISFVSAIGLARLHGAPSGLSVKIWQTLPVFFALSGWLGIGLFESWQRYWQRDVKEIGNFVFLSLSLLVGATIASFWANDWRFVAVTIFTCIASLIAQEIEKTNWAELTVLVWIGLLLTTFATFPLAEGFRLLGGYGSALTALVLAWMAASKINGRKSIMQGLNLTLAFALFRLFAEIYPLRAPRADLYTHYTFVGFLLGTSIPVLLMVWMDRERKFVRDLEVGFWSATIPVVIGSIWGVKAVAGYLSGGIAAVLLVSNFNLPTLFAGFAMALPLTAVVEPASDLPRKIRIWILAGSAIAFVLTLFFDAFVRRKRSERSSG